MSQSQTQRSSKVKFNSNVPSRISSGTSSSSKRPTTAPPASKEQVQQQESLESFRLKARAKNEVLQKMFKRGQEPVPQLFRHFHGHKSTINAVKFHPWRSNLVSCSSDGHILVWNFMDFTKRAMRYEGHCGSVNDVCFSNETGDLMVSVSDDSTAKVWVPSINGEVRSVKGHCGPIRTVDCHPTITENFLTGSDDKTVKLWNIRYRPRKHPGAKAFINPIEFVSSWACHTNWVRSVRYNAEGNLALTSSDDKTCNVIDLRVKEAGNRTKFLIPGIPNHAEFNPCADQYFGVSTNDNFLIYDTRTRKALQLYKDIHTKKITGFNFHTSGDFVYTTSEDSSMKILDIVEGRPTVSLFGAKNGLLGVHCSPDGCYVAGAGRDKTILIFETTLIPYSPEELIENGMIPPDPQPQSQDYTEPNPTPKSGPSRPSTSSKSRTTVKGKIQE